MDSSSNSKRRRGLGVVTPNACTECRKKRAKCDGQIPCGRCSAQKNVECVYEIPVRQSKEHMRNEIEQLRNQQRLNERVLAELVSSEAPDKILDQLRGGERIESIAEKLDREDSQSSVSGSNATTFTRLSDHQMIGNALRPARNTVSSPVRGLSYIDGTDVALRSQEGSMWSAWGAPGGIGEEVANPVQHDGFMGWDSETLPDAPSQGPSRPLMGTWYTPSRSNSTPDSTTQFARGQGQQTILGQTFGMEEKADQEHPNYNESWTEVTDDPALVEHLMALYFCWEYPTFASLSKEHFLDDFRAGRRRHCSPLLVNALLALGCRFSNQANTRTDPNDSNTAGDHFFAEALRLLNQEGDRHVLTTIQALGLMAIREASCGRSSESIFLSGQSIRLAIEMNLHIDKMVGSGEDADIEHAVRSATFWGAFSLDQAWSLSIGRLPHFSRDIKLVTKPAIIDHVEASSWIPYTDDGAPLEKPCTQPSNVRSVYKTFCELSEIVHKSLYILYTPGTNVTSKALLSAYTDFIHWYDEIPKALRLGHNFTPAVLFAHMYYHYAILLLFRPFIKLTLLKSSVSPHNVCTQAADAISALVNSYSQLYTLRRTPSFVPYFVLTSSVAHLVTLGNTNSGPDTLKQGISDLQEMTSCHNFAKRALDILRFLIHRWNVNFQFSPNEKENNEALEDIEDICRPSSTSFNQFCPNIVTVDLVSGIGPVAASDNPLFWIFPLQGRPMLDFDLVKLEGAGFRIEERGMVGGGKGGGRGGGEGVKME